MNKKKNIDENEIRPHNLVKKLQPFLRKDIKFLQSKNQLGKVEKLEIEDLQGVSGLKALRVEVIYNKEFNEEKAIYVLYYL